MSADDDLVAACDRKDVKAAAAALAAGASPDAKDRRGMSVLNTAIVLKSKSLATLLVNAGADVDATDGAGRAALHWLAEELPDADLAALCLDKGATLDRRDTAKYEGKTPLHRAVLRPKLDLAELLIERGANLELGDTDGDTPLLLLCKSASGEMSKVEMANAKWLVDKGADISHANHDGESPLHFAARTSTEMTQYLLAKGAKVTSNKWGTQPLGYYLSTNARDTKRWDMLIAAGCDVNHTDESGETPLHTAQVCWNPTAVAYLLAKGADPTIRSKDGKTALDGARELQQAKIIPLLEKATANTTTSAAAKPPPRTPAQAPAKKTPPKPAAMTKTKSSKKQATAKVTTKTKKPAAKSRARR